MRDQLLLLEELQSVDVSLTEAESVLKTLPEKLSALKADLKMMEALLDKERQALAETEKFRREQDQAMKDAEASIVKSKAKLQGVRTGKDYQAAQREIANTKQMMSDREEEIVKLLDALAASQKLVAAHEADVDKLREIVAAEEAQTSAKVAEVDASLAGQRAEREQVAAKVDPDLMKRYAHIRQRRGVAVVPVERGTCTGCRMTIPPQLYNMVQRGTSIETCPSCARLIYWDELLKQDGVQQA